MCVLAAFPFPPATTSGSRDREPLEPSLTFLPAKQHKALVPLGHNRKLGLDKQDPIKERTGASPLLLGSGINIETSWELCFPGLLAFYQ